METSHGTYVPISCDFHDLLESLATTGEVVRVLFRDEAGQLQACTSNVVDVFSRHGAEFLDTGGGESIRLDRLVEVNGVRLAGFAAEGAWCAA